MMLRAQFKEIVQKIEAVYCQDFNDLQFEEWWESFGDEDYDMALRAFREMKEEYKYFPMIATFRSYIEKIKEYETESRKPKREEPAPMDLDRHRRWIRYIRWTLETKQYPKTSQEAMLAKEKFEREYPNWQPKDKTDVWGQAVKNL